MSECNHDCASCGSKDCSQRSFLEKTNELSNVKKVIGVVSGKGGVGKSSVTSMLAVLANRKGYSTAILDADITGPSIPRAFGLKGQASGEGNMIFPVVTKKGIEVMSMNLLLEEETAPVIWRGPVLAGAVKQFWTDVVWGEVDYMFVDMPPGTGDVPLTVFQSIPLSGVVIVTTPQDLVEMIVKKAVNMADMMKVPVLGLVENMSYLTCPDCGRTIEPFGPSKAAALAMEHKFPAAARLPIDPKFAQLADEGMIEFADTDALKELFSVISSSREIVRATPEE